MAFLPGGDPKFPQFFFMSRFQKKERLLNSTFNGHLGITLNLVGKSTNFINWMDSFNDLEIIRKLHDFSSESRQKSQPKNSRKKHGESLRISIPTCRVRRLEMIEQRISCQHRPLRGAAKLRVFCGEGLVFSESVVPVS